MKLASPETMNWLTEFQRHCNVLPGPIPFSVSIGKPDSKTHFVLGAAVHGNEVGAIPAFVKALEDFDSKRLRARITFFIGNPAAVLVNRRFIDHNLNRIFGDDMNRSPEHERAREISSLLDTADYFVDFHQTIQPTCQPFYVCLRGIGNFDFPQFLAASDICVLDTALPVAELSTEQYVQRRGKTGVTLEIGELGLNEISFGVAKGVIDRIFELASFEAEAVSGEIATSSKRMRPMKKLEVLHEVKFSHAADHLNSYWKNLDRVTAGTLLATEAAGRSILAPCDGYICFPKYPQRDSNGLSLEPLPANLCEIAVEVP